MNDNRSTEDQIVSTLREIHDLLARSVKIQQEAAETDNAIHATNKALTQTVSDLLNHSTVSGRLAEQRTDMAKERTALVREQTRLSTRSTELSEIRTDMSRERTEFSSQRTNLAVTRTDFSRSRTDLAGQRNTMAERRTGFSETRTQWAGTRTTLSRARTSLAHGRTNLALIRTGLAFLSLSIAFFRMFGLSWWSVFDGALAAASLLMTGMGILGYRRSARMTRGLQQRDATGEEISV